MRLHYDISAGAFVSGWASNTLLRSDELSIKRSDALAIEFVPFTSTGLGIAEKATATGLQCGFFVPDEHGSNALFGTSTFVATLEDVDGVTDARRVYTGRPTSSTLEVATRFVGLTTHKTNSGAAYTLIASDADKLLALTHGSAMVLTLANAVAIGDSLVVLNNSTGQDLTLAAGTGISAITYDGVDETIVAGVVRMLTRTSSTEWTVSVVNEESSIEVDLEFQWEQDAERLSSSTLTITLYNDYLRDTETTPEALGLTSNYVTITAFDAVEDRVTDLEAQVTALEADYTGHTHIIADTTGLQAALDAKQATLANVVTSGTYHPTKMTLAANGVVTAVTDDIRAVHGAPVSVTGATTWIYGPLFTIPANTLAVGEIIELYYFGVTNNGTTASNLRLETELNGGLVGGAAIAMGTTAATSVPWLRRITFVVEAIGFGGALRQMAETHRKDNSELAYGVVAFSMDTTIENTLRAAASLSAAPSGSYLVRIDSGWIRKI